MFSRPYPQASALKVQPYLKLQHKTRGLVLLVNNPQKDKDPASVILLQHTRACASKLIHPISTPLFIQPPSFRIPTHIHTTLLEHLLTLFPQAPHTPSLHLLPIFQSVDLHKVKIGCAITMQARQCSYIQACSLVYPYAILGYNVTDFAGMTHPENHPDYTLLA